MNDPILDKLNSMLERDKPEKCKWCLSFPIFTGTDNLIFLKCSNKKCSSIARGFACFSCLRKDEWKIQGSYDMLVSNWNLKNK